MRPKILSFERYPQFARLLWWRTYLPFSLTRAGIDLGTSVQFFGSPIVSKAANSRIAIGSRSVICSNSRYTALGVNHAVVLRTLRSGAVISIGEDVGISGGSICAATSVVIGDRVLIGANVTISDTDFHPTNPIDRRFNSRWEDIGCAAVSIANNVFIGTNVIVLKGVTIGENSVIAAGAVVASDIPPNVIAVGVPARPIRAVVQT